MLLLLQPLVGQFTLASCNEQATTTFTLQPHAPDHMRLCALDDLKARKLQAASQGPPE